MRFFSAICRIIFSVTALRGLFVMLPALGAQPQYPGFLRGARILAAALALLLCVALADLVSAIWCAR
jgi:hypothetical protein